MFKSVYLLTCWMFLGSMGSAAEFAISKGPFAEDPKLFAKIRMVGEITDGDAARLANQFKEELADYFADSSYVSISLDSQGGAFSEALRLMDTFRALQIATTVEQDATCLSACALAFLGGSAIVASEFRVRRSIEPGATLGFHAPSLALPATGVVPVALLQSSYATALEAMSGIFDRRTTHEIQPSLIQAMIATPPSEMYILETVDDFARWQIDVEMDDARWVPDQADIARICMQYEAWSNGLSISKRDINMRDQGAPAMSNRVAELAKQIQFYEPSEQTGIKTVYAYISEQGMSVWTCVVELVNFRGKWSARAYTSSTSPDVAINAVMKSDGGGQRVNMLHALPFDFKIRDLR